MEKEIITINNVPEYIDTFLKNNYVKLNEIYNENSEQEKGCLYLAALKNENKMDVSFLNQENIMKIITKEMWESIILKSNGKKIYIVKEIIKNKNEINKNTMFIIYL